MKNRFIFYLLVLAVVAVAPVKQSMAQKNFTAEADDKFALNKYYDAIELYKKAYTKVKNKVEKNRILFQIGTCYYLINDMKNAGLNMKRVIKANYPEVEAYNIYAQSLKIQGNYEQALIAFNDFKAKYPDDKRADAGIESCKLAISWLDAPTRYTVEPDKKLNSRNADFSPAYFDKKYKAIVFTTSREEVNGRGEDNWTGLPFTDLFVTSQDKKGNYSTPVPLDEEGIVNSEANEGSCTFNSKFNTIYFTRCRKEKKKILGCEIYSSVKKGRSWAEPELIPIAPADSFTVGHPSLTDDELTMYFASNMPGGQGGRDIWMITRPKKNKPFEKAVNLGEIVNTPGDEMYPTIREIGGKKYLYFASNGHIGMGGLDIFRSEFVDGKWTAPVNMKAPLNSSSDDFAIIFNDDPKMLKEADAKEMGWFTTNRKGGRGNDDLWRFKLPPILFTLAGVVRDDSTKQILKGAEVRIEGSNGTIYTDSTDQTGSYYFDNIQIVENTTYNMMVALPDYYSEKGKETTVGLEVSKDLVHDYYLVPIPKKPIVLPDILYDLARWELKPQYEDSLDGLVTIMKENPTLVIELGSHTDIRSSDDYNDTLSYKRAKSCVDYIISQGVEPDRLVPKGYGERVPRVLESDKLVVYKGKEYRFSKGQVMTEDFINGLATDGEKEAAHQLNRRTTFQILRSDYVPKANTNTPVNPEIQIINEGGEDEGGEDEGEDTNTENPGGGEGGN
ncbi:MAG TPA: OmpA family protein [Bacteroidales bacterium]|nr:OmpA family protein [Bacteroidales bacterium]